MAPRKTRAAMRAETIHIDDTSTTLAAETPLPPTPKGDRAPLGDITPNSVDGADSMPAAEEEVALKNGKPKAKKAKPGKKGAKKHAAEDAGAGKEANGKDEEPEVLPEVLEDERKAAGSPASDAAAEELMNESTGNMTQVPMLDERPVSPPKAVRMTRRQLMKAEEQVAAREQFKESVYEPAVEYLPSEAQHEERVAPVHEMKGLRLQDDPPISQTNEPPVEVVPTMVAAEEAPENPTVTSSETKAEDDSSLPQSISKTPAKPTMRPEDSIAAIDALEDAIEEVGKTLSPLHISRSPEKQRKAKAPIAHSKANTRPSMVAKTPKSRPSVIKRAPASAAKAEQRKESSGSSAAATGTASSVRQSSGPSRSNSTRVSSAKQSTAPSETSSKPATVDYLASKRRPINLSFPTPPPPPKSSKPPTKPTFQLPGEAVAAKLKAAREERMKKEEEEAPKKREFKARPVRKSVAPIAVKQTAASKARQSLMHGGEPTAEEKENKGVMIQPLKRTSSIATNVNGKRQSTLAAKRTSAVVTKAALASTSKDGQESTSSDKPTTSTTVRSRPSSLHVPKTQTQPQLKPTPTTKRVSSTVSSTTSNTPAPGPAAKSTATAKGKEVFNRDKVEKEEMERRRREKEDAARKARAEAAERGRQASREWAERQKARKASGAGAGAVKAKEGAKEETAKEVSATA